MEQCSQDVRVQPDPSCLIEPKKVLIVDDDKDIVMLLSLHMEMAGFEPLSALDGRKALSAAANNRISLVVLDLMLPEFDGWEVCRCLKHNDSTKNIPVIILSALTDESSKARAVQAGADEYMTKPFSPKELVSRVNDLIRRT